MDERIRKKLEYWVEHERHFEGGDEKLFEIVWLTKDEELGYPVFVEIAQKVSCKDDPGQLFLQYEYLWLFADYINKILPFMDNFELAKE